MNKKISLLPHNQKLFNEIMDLIKNGEHSIFYSEATGLGKSFIFMSLVNELFKGKKVLYIVPKIAIWENINMYKEFEYIKDYVEMTTYADFNSTKIMIMMLFLLMNVIILHRIFKELILLNYAKNMWKLKDMFLDFQLRRKME